MTRISTTTASMERYSLTSLPAELLDNICQCLAITDLKSLRLSGKGFEGSVIKVLYETFVLYPHERSFLLLGKFAKSRQLASCTQTLIYDTRWRTCLYSVLESIEIRLAEQETYQIQGTSSGPTHEPQLSQIDTVVLEDQRRRAEALHSMDLVSWDPTALSTECIYDASHAGFLASALRALPNIQEIIVYDFSAQKYKPQYDFESLPKFFQGLGREIFGHDPTTSWCSYQVDCDDYTPYMYTWPVLKAAQRSSRPITSLKIRSLDWRAFFETMDVVQDGLQNVLQHVQTLELGCPDQDTYWHETDEYMEQLSTFFSFTPNLNVLHLSFRAADLTKLNGWSQNAEWWGKASMFNPEGDTEPYSSPATMLSSLPSLHTLTIEGLICSLTEFEDLLQPVCETLRHLTLISLELVPMEPFERRHALTHYQRISFPGMQSLIQAFRWLRANCQLKSIDLQGVFTNYATQHWDFSSNKTPCSEDPTDHSALLSSLKSYILRETEKCPLNDADSPSIIEAEDPSLKHPTDPFVDDTDDAALEEGDDALPDDAQDPSFDEAQSALDQPSNAKS